MSASESDRQLLPGESPDGDLFTAEHWIAVYSEFVRFLDALVGDHADEPMRLNLERRRARFLARLRFWESEWVRIRYSGQHD